LSARTGKSAGEREQIASRPFHYQDHTLRCDGVALDALAEQHGTPLYVYSAGQIRHRFSLFQQAFTGRPATVCYAVKANSSLAILRMLAELGAVHLLVEPGRFVAAQAGGLLTRVVVVKKNGAKTFVIVDAAMNDLIRPALYQAHHEILPVAKGRGASVKVDVVGPVCESGDFFAHDRTMPRVKAGELLLVLDAGAYGMSESSNYNTRARASEVLVEGNEARLIRRRETLRDLMAAEIL